MTTPSTPAGWYPDPEGSGGQRYWDGFAWTEHRAPAPAPLTAPDDSAGEFPGGDQETSVVSLPEQPTTVVRRQTSPPQTPDREESAPAGAHRAPDPEPAQTPPVVPSSDAPATPSYEPPSTPSWEVPPTPSWEPPALPSWDAPSTPSWEAPSTAAHDHRPRPTTYQPRRCPLRRTVNDPFLRGTVVRGTVASHRPMTTRRPRPTAHPRMSLRPTRHPRMTRRRRGAVRLRKPVRTRGGLGRPWRPWRRTRQPQADHQILSAVGALLLILVLVLLYAFVIRDDKTTQIASPGTSTSASKTTT